MRTKITLILLVLNVALFSYIFYFEERISTNRLDGDRSRHVFGSEVITDIDHLSLDGASASLQWALQRDRNHDYWRLTSPMEWPANRFAIQHILAQLHFLKAEASFPVSGLRTSGQSLDDYGLENPSLTLTFGHGERRRKILFGASTAVGNRIYLLDATGERIHVISQKFFDNLDLPLEALRDDVVIDIPLFEARSLSLQVNRDEPLKMRVIRDNNEWLFESPIQVRANKSAVEALLMRINGIKVDTFEPPTDDPSRFGLATPAMRVTVEGNTRSQVLLVGSQVPDSSDNPRYFAKLHHNPTVFTLNGRIVEDLKIAKDALRDPQFLRFERDNLTALTFEGAGEAPVSLQKLENGQWKIVRRQPDESIRLIPADEDILRRIVGQLEQVRAIRFPSNSPSPSERDLFGFGAPRRTITLTGEREITLLLGNENSHGEIYATIRNSPFVFTVDASLLDEIPTETRHFRDRILLRQPAGTTITSLRVTHLHRNEEIFDKTLPSRQSDWGTLLADEPEPVRTGALALLAELRNLRVQSYLLEEFPSNEEPEGGSPEWAWTYLIEATLSLSGSENDELNQFKLYLTDRLGGRTQLGGSSELNVIFSANQSLIDAFELLSRERTEPAPSSFNLPASET